MPKTPLVTQTQVENQLVGMEALLINAWDDIPGAEKTLIKSIAISALSGLSASLICKIVGTSWGCMLLVLSGTVTGLYYSANQYASVNKPKQDALVDNYHALITKSNDTLFYNPAYAKDKNALLKEFGDDTFALHNACILRRK